MFAAWPVLDPKSYGGARVLEASGRPMLVIERIFKMKEENKWKKHCQALVYKGNS